jgi:hypothetical protein
VKYNYISCICENSAGVSEFRIQSGKRQGHYIFLIRVKLFRFKTISVSPKGVTRWGGGGGGGGVLGGGGGGGRPTFLTFQSATYSITFCRFLFTKEISTFNYPQMQLKIVNPEEHVLRMQDNYRSFVALS